MKSRVSCALIIGACAAVLHGASPAEPTTASSGRTDAGLVERFLRSDRPVLRTYRARRRLEAVTMGGKMRGLIEAWTYVDAAGRLQFDVIREEGSGLIRDRVLRAALETEQDNYNRHEVRQVELNRDNYDFRIGTSSGDLVAIAMQPRRVSPMLLNGTVTVARDDGDVVRIDGSPSERPSWWTTRVEIVRRYARINGVRVPVEMSSTADVRVAGESTFQMTYDYTMINGRVISGEPRADQPGPRGGVR